MMINIVGKEERSLRGAPEGHRRVHAYVYERIKAVPGTPGEAISYLTATLGQEHVFVLMCQCHVYKLHKLKACHGIIQSLWCAWGSLSCQQALMDQQCW
jgi:hypothetical protein